MNICAECEHYKAGYWSETEAIPAVCMAQRVLCHVDPVTGDPVPTQAIEHVRVRGVHYVTCRARRNGQRECRTGGLCPDWTPRLGWWQRLRRWLGGGK